jgi:glycosyltransferase involved in cell wall biosynthesis
VDEYDLPTNYAFSVCRIEPENNIHVILEAFSKLDEQFLVMVGNWNNSEYGRALRQKYSSSDNLFLLDPIYDLGKLKTLRSCAVFYIHGHSAGGTNPALVEAMHFGKPVLAFDCDFNRSTTEDKAFFFNSSASLINLIATMDLAEAGRVGRNMLEIAERRYTWRVVAQQYFKLLGTLPARPGSSNI